MFSQRYKPYLKLFLSSIIILIFAISACSGEDTGANADGDEESTGPCPQGAVCDPCLNDFDCPAGFQCDDVAMICIPFSNPDGDDPHTDGEVPDDGDIEDKPDGDGYDGPIDNVDGRIIEVIPTDVDFGNVQLGETHKEFVEIRNGAAATEDLEVQSIIFVNEGVIDFTFRPMDLGSMEEIPLPVTLKPGANFQLEIVYAPSDAEDDTGEQLLISSNDADASVVRVTLSPKYKGEATLVVEPNPIGFEDVSVDASEEIGVMLVNRPADTEANRVLKISGVTLANGTNVDGAFLLTPSAEVTGDNPIFLAPGEGFQVSIRFSPNLMTDFTNTLVVTCNDLQQGPNVEIPITGGGTQSDLEITPNPIAFGPKPVNFTHFMPVEIRNVGSEPFPVENLGLDQGNPVFAVEESSISPNLPWLLLPGEFGQVNVSFSPDIIQVEEDALLIATGSAFSDYLVEMRGSGASDEGFESNPPSCILRIDGYEEFPPDKVVGTSLILDVVAEDPDGGSLIDYEFEVQTSPPGSDTVLSGNGPSRTSQPNMVGTWEYRARARDDEGEWSDWDDISINIVAPETLTIVMTDANLCISGIIGYDLIFYSLEDEECGPSPAYTCTWGPNHSGSCAGISHNDAGSEILWDYSELGGVYPDLDGEYRIRIHHSIALFGETIEMKLYKNGSSGYYWSGEHKFELFGGSPDWDVFLRRSNGIWEEPYLCTPGGCN